MVLSFPEDAIGIRLRDVSRHPYMSHSPATAEPINMALIGPHWAYPHLFDSAMRVVSVAVDFARQFLGERK